MTELDFHCRVCGKETDVAPDPPARAVCEEHCEDHDYKYDQWDRGWFCVHCNKPRPCVNTVREELLRAPGKREG